LPAMTGWHALMRAPDEANRALYEFRRQVAPLMLTQNRLSRFPGYTPPAEVAHRSNAPSQSAGKNRKFRPGSTQGNTWNWVGIEKHRLLPIR